MWGSGSQSPLDFGNQSQGGMYGLSQESGFGVGSQSQSPFDLSQTQYSQSQLSQSQLSQPSIPECTECHSTEMHTTDDGDMVSQRGADVGVVQCRFVCTWRRESAVRQRNKLLL